jgi:hypothetical protein
MTGINTYKKRGRGYGKGLKRRAADFSAALCTPNVGLGKIAFGRGTS